MPHSDESASLRKEHVRRCISARGVKDPRVLKAMSEVPREAFAEGVPLASVYGDYPLPIGCGQTISQPFMVAWMTEVLELKPHDRVLEIGTGSGYQTAILASLVDAVYTIEYYRALSKRAEKTLLRLGFANIHFRVGDGSLGWPEEEPFDAIIVTAGAPVVPGSLKRQLRDGGRLAIPVGNRFLQELVLVRRKRDQFIEQQLGGCRFVPLQGKEGWGSSSE